MGYDNWNHSKFLYHKVRNMSRRGWLIKTYNDKKMLRGRVKTGEKIENDELDIVHPVGFVAHVEASGKHEVLTQDIGADTSKRLITMVMGDREEHPQPDENEMYIYAPNRKKMFLRFKKKKQGGGQGGGGGGSGGGGRDVRAPSGGGGGGQSQAQTKESGRIDGMHWDGEKDKVSGKTEETFQNKADKGQGYETKESYDIEAGKNTQFKASKHVRQGQTMRDSPEYVNGIVHAKDHLAGGGAQISGVSRIAARFTNDNQENWQSQSPDGNKEWQAQGKNGHTSLLQTAAKVGTLGGMMNMMGGMMGMLQQMMQNQNDKNEEQNAGEEDEEMRELLRQLEEARRLLQEQQDLLAAQANRPAEDWQYDS